MRVKGAELERPVDIHIPINIEFDGGARSIAACPAESLDFLAERYLATGNGKWLIKALRELYRSRPQLEWVEATLLWVLEQPPPRLAAALSDRRREKVQRESVERWNRNRAIQKAYKALLDANPGIKKTVIKEQLAADWNLGVDSINKILREG
jgi:hypothetical protein